MPVIRLETEIDSTLEVCFDLASSIDLHVTSMGKSKERAVAGRTSGLIQFGESVTWEATHFGFRQHLTSRITAFQRPYHFRDEQMEGVFKYFVHDHHFVPKGIHTLMHDTFEYQAPLGLLGELFSNLILRDYMTRMLSERNKVIKDYAESGKWKSLLTSSDR